MASARNPYSFQTFTQKQQQIEQDDMTKRYQYHTQQQPKSNLFFRIIEEGVDDIILKLKNAIEQQTTEGFIGEINTTNDGAKQIFDKLNALSQSIKTQYGIETAEGIETQLKNSMENAKTTGNNGDMDFYYASMKQMADDNAHKILATKIQQTEKTPSNNVIEINNRLEACVNLEYLYLNKHQEIINIFSFVLQLFEKYKYAIKVILYLLKNLVRVPGQPIDSSNPLTINLPKPIIKNIFTLVQDQDKIQTVVNQMKDVVNDTDISNIQDSNKTKINTNLGTTTTPSASASSSSSA
jgi:hypothetical protein